MQIPSCIPLQYQSFRTSLNPVSVSTHLTPSASASPSFPKAPLVSVILSPVVGYLADTYSTKRAWLRTASLVTLVGTGMVVSAGSPIVLFTGRFVQALASTVAWVVGYVTIADNVKMEHLGKTYGLISMVLAISSSTGPMISGMMFDLGGYWLAWLSACLVIICDVVLRLLMLERPKESRGKEPSAANDSGDFEDAPFLHEEPVWTKERTGLHFYSIFSATAALFAGYVCTWSSPF